MATTVLWAGGEDIDFSNVGAITYDQTATHFDGTKARGAIVVPNASGVTQASVGNAVAFTAASTLWVHANSYVGGGIFTDNNICIALTDASGVERFQIGMLNGSGGGSQVSLVKQDGAGHSTTLITGSLQIAADVLEPFDVAVTMASAGGSFAFYQNNTLLASFSGNTLTDNQTTLTGFLLGSINQSGASTYYSEVIAANGDTRSMRLNTTIASGLGNTNTWTVNGGSSAWQNVSQWVTSNNINIAVAASSQLAEFTTSTLVSGAWAVAAVVTSAYALAGTSGGPQHIAHVIRTAATDYSGATLPLLSSLQNSKVVWSSNPSTGNNWQQSDITNPGFNFGVVSEP
jgi:hypothetical protein